MDINNAQGLSQTELTKLYREKRDAYRRTAESILNEAERHGGFSDREQMDFDRIVEKLRVVQDSYEQSLAAGGGSAPITSTTTAPVRGDHFASFGEQLRAVAMAGTPGGQTDPRLYEVLAASGASEGVGSSGGFLIEHEFSREILKRIYDVGTLAGRCRRIPVTVGSGIKIPRVKETSRADGSRWGGVAGYWSDEAGTVTATKPAFEQLDIPLRKLMAIGYATDELLEDSAALGVIMRDAFASELAFKLDDAILNGDGTGKPLGILQAACTVEQAKESGQAAATVVYENVLSMWTRMWGRSRRNAIWLISQDIEPQLYSMSLAVGTGGSPIFLPGGGASDKPYATLFGRPIIPCEQCATLGTIGDIVLADLSEYLLVTKGGIRSDQSMHVRFIYGEQAFRCTYRIGGQPAWSAAVSPFKGSDDVSPFVALETRS